MHESTDRLPVAVLVSGSGSNLQAIIDAASSPSYPARVVVVISDRPGVRALDRAAAAGIACEVVAWSEHPDRASFTKAVCDAVDDHGAAAMVLAGFMRVLDPHAIARFPNRILNIHPALLPSFPGAHAVRDAIAHGAKVTGVTVHLVDEQVDHGPIVSQRAIDVEPDDDEATLHARLQRLEHEMYPEAVAAFARDELTIEGRRVTWRR